MKPIYGYLEKDQQTLRDTKTIPPYFNYITTQYLKNKGYNSPFFNNVNSYFTTYGGNGNNGKKEILLTWFKKGSIEIWFGLFYAGCPPMVVSIQINDKIIYMA